MHQSISDIDTTALPAVSAPASKGDLTSQAESSRVKFAGWLEAFKQVLPIYLATHIAFLALTYLASLFSIPNFAGNNRALHLSTLLHSWSRWDTAQFTYIATHGYDAPYRTAFFPLFPLLERVLAFVVRDPFVAGLIISNMATLGVFMVLYRLVTEDFGAEQAWRSVLYLAVFPTAFFFVVAYNESLFVFFTLLSFYYMRKGRWWIAGLAALFASLTRSIAVCLFIPFVYDYLRQRDFQVRKIRFDVLSAVGIVGGIVIFGIYGYLTFHDFLAFSHAQAVWLRQPSPPWLVFWEAYEIIKHNPILSFISIHTVIDLSATLFILVILVLAFVGPWKLSKEHWSYALYAVAIYLFVVIVPEAGRYPLSSLARFMIEIFPVYVVLAAMGQKRNFNLYYLAICLPLLTFLLLQWLTGGWIV